MPGSGNPVGGPRSQPLSSRHSSQNLPPTQKPLNPSGASEVTSAHMLVSAKTGTPSQNVSSDQFVNNSPAAETQEKTQGFFAKIWASIFGKKAESSGAKKTFWQKTKEKFSGMTFWRRTKVEVSLSPVEVSLSPAQKITALSPQQKHAIINESIKYLNNNGALSSVGIFRVPPDSGELFALSRAASDIKLTPNPQVPTETVSSFSIADANVNTVASLMKQTLSGLFDLTKDGPDKVFYDSLLKIVSRKPPDQIRDVKDVKAQIDQLPRDKKILLQDLFGFLNTVQLNNKTNLMTANNLAVVVTPKLFSVGEDIKDNAKAAAAAMGQPIPIVQFLIEHALSIFPEEFEYAPPEVSSDEISPVLHLVITDEGSVWPPPHLVSMSTAEPTPTASPRDPSIDDWANAKTPAKTPAAEAPVMGGAKDSHDALEKIFSEDDEAPTPSTTGTTSSIPEDFAWAPENPPKISEEATSAAEKNAFGLFGEEEIPPASSSVKSAEVAADQSGEEGVSIVREQSEASKTERQQKPDASKAKPEPKDKGVKIHIEEGDGVNLHLPDKK